MPSPTKQKDLSNPKVKPSFAHPQLNSAQTCRWEKKRRNEKRKVEELVEKENILRPEGEKFSEQNTTTEDCMELRVKQHWQEQKIRQRHHNKLGVLD